MGDFGFGGPTNDDPEDPDQGDEANTGDVNLDPSGPSSSANPLNPNSQVSLFSQISPVAAPDDSTAYGGGSSPYGTYSADSSETGYVRPPIYNDLDTPLDDDPSPDGALIAQGQAYGPAVAAVIGAVTDLVVGTVTDALSDLLGLAPSDENDTDRPAVSAIPMNVVTASGNQPVDNNDGATSLATQSALAPTPSSPSFGAIAPSLTNPSVGLTGSGSVDLIAQQTGAPGLVPGAISEALIGPSSGNGLNPWARSNPSSSALPGIQNAATMGFRENLPAGFNGATATAAVPSSIKTAILPNTAEGVAHDVIRGALTTLLAPNGANVQGPDGAYFRFVRDPEGILQLQLYGLGVKSSTTGTFPADKLEPHSKQQIFDKLSTIQFEDPEQADAVARSLADPNAEIKFLRATVDNSPSGQGRITINGFAIADPEYVPGDLVVQGPSLFSAPPPAAADEEFSGMLDTLEPGEWPSYFDLPPSTPGFSTQDGIPLGDSDWYLMPRGFLPGSNNLSSGIGASGYPGANTVADLTDVLSGALIAVGIAGIAIDISRAPPGEGLSRGVIDTASFGATIAFALIFPEISLALILASSVLQSRSDVSGPHTDA